MRGIVSWDGGSRNRVSAHDVEVIERRNAGKMPALPNAVV
jgi:hypothetical protein